MCASALPRESGTHEIGVDMSNKTSKNILDVTDCNLKKDDQIFIVLGTSISVRTGHQMIVQVPTSPSVCFCTTCKNQNKRNIRWNEQKPLINFISPDLWPQKALTSVHSLTVFAVSCSSGSIGRRSGMLMNSTSDWWKSGAEHYWHCYEWMDKASTCLCSHKWLIFRIFFVYS